MQHEHFEQQKNYRVTPIIESLRTMHIAFFRFATPSGFLGGRRQGTKRILCKGPCKGKSYETICENIVSWYQTLVSSLRFSAQATENQTYNWAALKGAAQL